MFGSSALAPLSSFRGKNIQTQNVSEQQPFKQVILKLKLSTLFVTAYILWKHSECTSKNTFFQEYFQSFQRWTEFLLHLEIAKEILWNY